MDKKTLVNSLLALALIAIIASTFVFKNNDSDQDYNGGTNSAIGTSYMSYKSGQYKVGSDIPAGEYCLIQDGKYSAYMCISSDSNKDDIIDNDNFENFIFVTVENGQYFELSRCYAIPASDVKQKFDESNLTAAMYRVGIDIPAGEYKLTQTKTKYSSYLCVYDNSTAYKEIITNDNYKNFTYVTVENGQYFYFSDATAEIIKNTSSADKNDNSENISSDTVKFTAGTYKVGVDIPAGEYYLEQNSDYGYFRIQNPNDFKDALMSDVLNHGYATVSDGYELVLSNNVFAYSVNDISVKYDSSCISPGVYRVGIDIPAGTYICTPVSTSENAEWESFYFVYDSSRIDRKTLQESFIGASNTVTVEDGQYLELSRCNGSLKK